MQQAGNLAKSHRGRSALILGIGNPLRGDDGLGYRVAERLAETIVDRSMNILAVHQLVPELAEPVSAAEFVLFVDASRDLAPGCRHFKEIAPDPDSTAVQGHSLSAQNLLAYAEAIFHAQPRAFLLSIGAESFGHCETLTPIGEKALSEVEEHIRCELLPALLGSATQRLLVA